MSDAELYSERYGTQPLSSGQGSLLKSARIVLTITTMRIEGNSGSDQRRNETEFHRIPSLAFAAVVSSFSESLLKSSARRSTKEQPAAGPINRCSISGKRLRVRQPLPRPHNLRSRSDARRSHGRAGSCCLFNEYIHKQASRITVCPLETLEWRHLDWIDGHAVTRTISAVLMVAPRLRRTSPRDRCGPHGPA
jgi:hypothetical protein